MLSESNPECQTRTKRENPIQVNRPSLFLLVFHLGHKISQQFSHWFLDWWRNGLILQTWFDLSISRNMGKQWNIIVFRLHMSVHSRTLFSTTCLIKSITRLRQWYCTSWRSGGGKSARPAQWTRWSSERVHFASMKWKVASESGSPLHASVPPITNFFCTTRTSSDLSTFAIVPTIYETEASLIARRSSSSKTATATS